MTIKEGLQKLTFRQREVMKLRLGITYRHSRPYSRPEIARIFKTTVGRIRWLEKKARLKLAALGVTM